jgi:hypothetical protein
MNEATPVAYHVMPTAVCIRGKRIALHRDRSIRSRGNVRHCGSRAPGLFAQAGRSAPAFNDVAASWPQADDVRTQAIRDREIVDLRPAETRHVVAAFALLLRRALMLAPGCGWQHHDRHHGNGKSPCHPLLLGLQSACRQAPAALSFALASIRPKSGDHGIIIVPLHGSGWQPYTVD